MKLKYEINLVSLGILVAVACAVAFAGVAAINQVTWDLNRKLMAVELKRLVTSIRSAHQVLKESGVERVQSYVERAKRDLFEEFRDYRCGQTGCLLIVEMPDRIVFHGNSLAQSTVKQHCLPRMLQEGSGTFQCEAHGSSRIFSFQSFPEWRWLVALSMETSEIMEARRKFLHNVLFIVLASLLGGALLFVWFTDRLVKPIRQLATAATSVSHGEWDAPIPTLEGESEIAQLATAFGAMSRNLSESYNKLHENLEQIARSREELRESRERFRSLVETTSDWVWEVDENGVYTYVSPQVRHLLGYEAEEILGRTPFDLMPREEAEQVRSRYAAISESTGGFAGLEKLNRHKDGRLVTLESSGVPYFDGHGVFRGYRGIDRDITERKRSEDAFRNLILSAPIGIFIVQDGRFKLVNPGFVDITGYSEAELIEDNISSSLPEELRNMARSSESRALLEGPCAPFELQLTTRDGQTRWVMQTVSRTQHAGRTAALGYFIDITERKHLENELFQSLKLQAIGQLAGGVAHDFNNLMTAVLGYADLILDRIDLGDPVDGLRDDVEQIRKAGERAASLTRQLLAFSRKQVMQPQVMDLNAAVKDMEQMLRRLIGEDIELLAVPARNLAPVYADHSQIGQVIMNLAVNARDAMPQGGRLIIETANVHLNSAYAHLHQVEAGPYVLLSVSDTGRGMDRQTRDHVFEPFFTTKGMGKGTGLGLATVYGIIKQSRGHIAVYSELGHGSTFKIYLPVAQGPGKPGQSTALPPTIPGGSEAVLLVEDDTLVRRMAVDALKRNGYRVSEASNGLEALKFLTEGKDRFALVITDVIMPGMSGRELADRLAELDADSRVLFMSGYTENAIVHHGVLDPGLAFIQKPFTPLELARKVREVLDA